MQRTQLDAGSDNIAESIWSREPLPYALDKQLVQRRRYADQTESTSERDRTTHRPQAEPSSSRAGTANQIGTYPSGRRHETTDANPGTESIALKPPSAEPSRSDHREDESEAIFHQNIEEALEGKTEAQFRVGCMYLEGWGVRRDVTQAIRWFQTAAMHGQVAAQFNLGVICDRGDGIERDPRSAAEWYRRAAEQGLRESQYSLGVKYGRADGLPLDRIESFRWIRYSASQGHTASQWLVASFYFEGVGVFQDNVEAHRWALLAKHRDRNIDPVCIGMLRKIQKSLDSKQIRYDNEYASQWKVKQWEQIKPTRNDPEQIETSEGPRFQLDGPIQAVKKVLDRWQVSTGHTAQFMGFDSSMQKYVEELLTGRRMLVQGSETEDRIAILYYIRCVLGALFRDKEVENEWLRRSHPELGGKSPMHLMQSGSRTDLLTARHHVDWVSGRLGC